jgi:hypothetical protein
MHRGGSQLVDEGMHMYHRHINLAKLLGRRIVSALSYSRSPSFDLRLSGVIGLVRSSSTGKVLHPWLQCPS